VRYTFHASVDELIVMTHIRLLTWFLVVTSGLLAPATLAAAQTLFVAGDSTASEYGPEQYPRMGWGQVLGDFYGSEIRVADLAQSGRSARSFIDEGFFADLERQIGPGDVLLIQFGHNDEKVNSPERYAAPDTDYKVYLGKYIAMARDKGATPVLLTPLVRRKFEDRRLVSTHGRYPAPSAPPVLMKFRRVMCLLSPLMVPLLV
jgi:lysophospholipase L1-like esterase